jgi:hypothetical protein
MGGKVPRRTPLSRFHGRALELWEPLAGEKAAEAKWQEARRHLLGFLVGWAGVIIFALGFRLHGSALGWTIRMFGLAVCVLGGFGFLVASIAARSRFRRLLANHYGIAGRLPQLPASPARFEEWRQKWVGAEQVPSVAGSDGAALAGPNTRPAPSYKVGYVRRRDGRTESSPIDDEAL